jgi:hypothetical protein
VELLPSKCKAKFKPQYHQKKKVSEIIRDYSTNGAAIINFICMNKYFILSCIVEEFLS